MTIFFFGRLADVFGPVIDMAVPDGCSVGELKSKLAERNPDAAHALGGRTRVCIGDSFVTDGTLVRATDRVELIPPVSGG